MRINQLKLLALLGISTLGAATFAVAEPATMPVQEPQMMEEITPDYPTDALRNKKTGYVVLSYTISSQGNARNIKVVESEPGRLFVRSAVKALHASKFYPVTVDGAAVGSEEYMRRYVFDLENVVQR